MVLLSDNFICIFYPFLMYFSSLYCIWDRKYSSLLLLWKLHSRTIRDLNDLHSLWVTHDRKIRLECGLRKSQPFYDQSGRDEVANCMISALYFLIFFCPSWFCQHTFCVQDYRMGYIKPTIMWSFYIEQISTFLFKKKH